MSEIEDDTKCVYCKNKEKSRGSDTCSQLCSFYSVSTWSDDEIIEELTRPNTHNIDPFAFHVMKEAIGRILGGNELKGDNKS